MKARGRLLILLCAAAALLAAPAAAAAKADPVVHPGSFQLEVQLPESNGWAMSITAEDHRQVYVHASRGAANVAYKVTGRASSRRVKADFGPLGRVDLRMDLDARPLYPPLLREILGPPRHCRGKEPVELVGRFHGIVDFEGEATIAGVSARSGRATVERTFRTVCPRRPAKPSTKHLESLFEISLIEARAHGGARTTSFKAIVLGLDSEALLGLTSGNVHERRGRVRIIRSANGLIEEPESRFGPQGRKVQTASFEPSEPFTGSASFLKRSGSPATWNGNLAVPLAGIGEVPLSGPEFDARICHAKGSRLFGKLGRCLLEFQTLSFPSNPTGLLRALYGSGSHSQPLALARLSSLR